MKDLGLSFMPAPSLVYSLIYQSLCFILLPLTVFSPQGITILFYGLAIICLLEISKQYTLQTFLKENINLIYFIGILFLFTFLSYFWSLVGRESLKGSLRITSLSFAGLIIFTGFKSTLYQKKIMKALFAGFILAVALLFFEMKTQGLLLSILKQAPVEMFKYNKSTSIIILFLMPLLYLTPNFSFISKNLWFRNLKIFLVIALCYIIFSLKSDASKLALVMGSIMFLMSLIISSKFHRILMQMIMILGLFAPFIICYLYKYSIVQQLVFSQVQKLSFYDRLSLWTNIQDIAFQKSTLLPFSWKHLILGYGMESSKAVVFSGQYREWEMPYEVAVAYQHSSPYPIASNQGIPLHPHNFILQFLLELGHIGVIYLFIFMEFFLKGISKIISHRFSRAAVSCMFISGFIIASISYGIWQSWWICTLWLTASFAQFFKKTPINNEQVY